MWGQWLGEVNGTNTGFITINIDEDRNDHGRLLFRDYGAPGLSASIALTTQGDLVSAELSNFVADPTDVVEDRFIIPHSGTLHGQFDGTKIVGKWSTDVGTSGEFTLEKYEFDDPTPANHVWTWEEYKSNIDGVINAYKNVIFRGVSSNSYRLRTAFHRKGRRDLYRYTEHIPELSRAIGAVTGRRYDLNNDRDYAALLYLAQHHGYPTPLLDWTESPYVAAFFAFRNASRRDEKYVRIFALDAQILYDVKVRPNIAATGPMIAALPHIDVMDNPRAIPQQSVVTFSNIFEIEAFIDALDARRMGEKTPILKIDILCAERDKVMRELKVMGITAASLFPGLDGVCESLREKQFMPFC